jgi:hypothetical protein
MATGLGEVPRCGDTSIAAIIDTTIHCHVSTGAAGIHGQRSPVAILVGHGATTVAFDTDGRTIPIDELDQRYRPEREEFEHIVDELNAP